MTFDLFMVTQSEKITRTAKGIRGIQRQEKGKGKCNVKVNVDLYSALS